MKAEDRRDLGYILPDSRMRNPTNIISGPGGNWVPIYCANCGTDCGLVPEENMQFVCWLCQPCADKHGVVIGTYMMPDEVFWKKVEEAQLEKYARLLGTAELQKMLDDANHPLAKLLRERGR